MNFCSQCGAKVSLRVPAGDDRPRHICDDCGVIHYQNPNIVAGCIPQWEDKVLLCRRGIEPRYGRWTLPAGFMENAETMSEAASREAREEACTNLEMGPLFTAFSIPHIDQVYVIYRARLLDLDFAAGEESLEVALFTEAEIPWSEIAFPPILRTLQLYFEDCAAGQFRVHDGDILRNPRDRFNPTIRVRSG